MAPPYFVHVRPFALHGATMDSADFCELDRESFLSWRCPVDFRVLWLPRRFPRDLIQTPVAS